MNTESEIENFYKTLFEVLSTSARVAYKNGRTERSYQELKSHCLQFVTALQKHNKAKIIVCAEKSFENYALILAILFTNNVWVPISADTPLERMLSIVATCEPDLFIYDDTLASDIVSSLANNGVANYNLNKFGSVKQTPEYNLPRRASDDLSMIYFTSGSTGTPKGVKIKHESFVRNVNNMLDVIKFPDQPVVADLHELSFVISIPVIFPCLLLEGTLTPLIDVNDKLRVASFIQRNEVNVLITVPSTFNSFRKEGLNKIKREQLSTIILCGEPCYADIVDLIYENFEVKNFYNFYGSTEVAPWIFYHECNKEDVIRYQTIGSLPIGKPIEGNEVKILNEELLISGVQVTPGYLNNEDQHKFVVLDGAYWFKTGDRVVKTDGLYFCKGRTDNLVKIAGKRVDLGDIETALRLIANVKNAVCFTDSEKRPAYVVAFIHLNDEIDYGTDFFRKTLTKSLPNYMIPRKFILSFDPPLNRSGKVDRAKIKKYYRKQNAAAEGSHETFN